MNVKMLCTVFSAAICAPTLAINYPDQPLVSGVGVQHNLLFVMDDTGSMQWETFFNSIDGLPGFIEADGSFVGSDGSINSLYNGIYYGHLFSQKGISYYLRVPPLTPYAFMRSYQWNPAYYDPTTTYEPWPSYAGITWSDADPTKAWYDPARTDVSDQWLNLTAQQDGDFDIKPTLLCDELGNACGGYDEHAFNYYPATYYKPNTTDTYEYDTLSSGSSVVYIDPASKGQVFEPTVLSAGFEVVESTEASGGEYYLYPTTATNYYNNVPVDSTLTVNFSTATDRIRVFIRRKFPTQNDDSFWISVDDHMRADILSDDADQKWVLTGTAPNQQDWHAWRNRHTDWPNYLVDQFIWEEWGDVLLNGSGNYTLRIKGRDNDAAIDQVLIATDLSYRPDWYEQDKILTNTPLSNEVRSCVSGYSPSYYHQYQANPAGFLFPSSVHAIAPDGSCLTRVEIKNTGASFDHGNGLVRTYAQEMQNFANWYVYHRNRSNVMRNAVGLAMQGVTNVFAGMYWFNKWNTVTMHDLTSSSGQNTFLDDHYSVTFGGGTPLRDALHQGANQLKRTTDPIITSYCQLNYGLIFTDGFNNNSFATGPLDNVDGDNGSPYADTQSDTLADIAMHYYETDLAENLGLTTQEAVLPADCPDSGGVPADQPWLDCNDKPHLKTYGISFGLPGLSVFDQPIINHDASVTPADKKYRTTRDVYDHPPTWPDNMTTWDKRQIDDLYHATVNGRGEMFIATKPSELTTQFSEALQTITNDMRSGSGVTVNTVTLDQEAFVFSANFDPGRWSGQFIANHVAYDDNDLLQQQQAWQANTELFDDFATAFTLSDSIDLTTVNSNSRVVVTYSDVNEDGRFHGVPFRWDADLDPSQRADLNLSTQTAAADGNGEARLHYLRGVLYETRYPGDYRDRAENILGTIVNSDPAFIGQTRTGRRWPDQDPFGVADNRYQQHFIIDELLVGNRTPMVYVGANDGMLHGFEAATGVERLAYVPRTLFSSETSKGLHYLSSPLYSHRFMVDGPLSAEDVYISDNGSSIDWMTVLVGSFRSGGRGIFALNVTNPNFVESNADSIALWEFSPTTLPGLEIGHQINPVRIGMMADHSWSVIVGSGTDLPTPTAHGGVYILNIQGGSDGRWDGADYRFLSVDTPADIVSVAAVDADNDYIIERLYAADLQGRVWAFDVSDSDPNNWGSAYSLAGNAQPLFSTASQPISAPLLVVRQISAGQSNDPPNLLVVFGTGQYLEPADDTNTNVQSFYTVWDHGIGGLTRTDLTVRTLSTTVENGFTVRHTTGLDWYHFDPGSDGFYFDFANATDPNDADYLGERVLNRPFVRLDDYNNQTVVFATTRPVVDLQSCAKEYKSWLMFVNIDTGHDSSSAFNPNDPTQPYEGQVSGFLIDDSNGLNDVAGLFNNQGGEQMIGADTEGNIFQLGELADPFTRRNKAWRELYRQGQ